VPDSATTGGVYSDRLFDSNGLNIAEQVEKGIFTALLYYQSLQTLNDGIDAKDIDIITAYWGASPYFRNSGKAVSDGDVFCASYAAQRDKDDGAGLYTQMKTALITAQAAIKAGHSYISELRNAIEQVKITWEKSQMATAINYLYSTITVLSATSIDDATRSSAIKSFGEGALILKGWRSLDENQRTISTAQLDELLELLHLPYHHTPQCYLIWQQPYEQLPRLEQVINKLQSIYGFTNQDMNDFKHNWVSEQGRY